MNTRHRLDDAIDAVAARLTRVDDNAALAAQIITALPERVTWFGWLFHSWAPRLAMIAVVVAAGMVWGSRGQTVRAPDLSPIVSTRPITTPTVLVTAVREAEPNRTMPLEDLEPLERMEPAADFEFSLPAIAAPDALSVSVLAPESLAGAEALSLAPLTIAELSLTEEQ